MGGGCSGQESPRGGGAVQTGGGCSSGAGSGRAQKGSYPARGSSGAECWTQDHGLFPSRSPSGLRLHGAGVPPAQGFLRQRRSEPVLAGVLGRAAPGQETGVPGPLSPYEDSPEPRISCRVGPGTERGARAHGAPSAPNRGPPLLTTWPRPRPGGSRGPKHPCLKVSPGWSPLLRPPPGTKYTARLLRSRNHRSVISRAGSKPPPARGQQGQNTHQGVWPGPSPHIGGCRGSPSKSDLRPSSRLSLAGSAAATATARPWALGGPGVKHHWEAWTGLP